MRQLWEFENLPGPLWRLMEPFLRLNNAPGKSAHGCLNITHDFGLHVHLATRDQNPIHWYRSCYSGPMKLGAYPGVGTCLGHY